MKSWICIICGFIYEEAKGLPEEGIPPGTRWVDVPDDWLCPECGVGKADFEMIEIDGGGAGDSNAAPAVETAPSSADDPVIIIGSGHAGIAAAEALRRKDPALPIMLLTEDGGERYSKPQLSIAVSAGQRSRGLVLETAAALADRLRLTIHTGCTVQRIDPARRTVDTSLGGWKYRALVLATGASPLRLPWYDEDVLSLNHLADLDRLHAKLVPGAQVGIIGAGFVGCELADDLISAGYRVSVIAASPYPLDRVVPQELGRRLQDRLSQRGAQWHLGTGIQSSRREGSGYRLTLADGGQIAADVLVSAVGFRPRAGLARQAGLDVADGVLVNADCRSSDPHVYALGDVAQYPDGLLPFIAPIGWAANAIACAVLGIPAEAGSRVFPVKVKTPSFPLALVSPAGREVQWETRVAEDSVEAVAKDREGLVRGFAVGGKAAGSVREWLDRIAQ